MDDSVGIQERLTVENHEAELTGWMSWGRCRVLCLGPSQRAGWGAVAGWKLNRRQQDGVAAQAYKHIFKNPVSWIKKVEKHQYFNLSKTMFASCKLVKGAPE